MQKTTVEFDRDTGIALIQLSDTTIPVRFDSVKSAAFQRFLGVDPLVHITESRGMELFIANGITAATTGKKSGTRWTQEAVLKKLDEHKKRPEGAAMKYITRAILCAYVADKGVIEAQKVFDEMPAILNLDDDAEYEEDVPAPPPFVPELQEMGGDETVDNLSGILPSGEATDVKLQSA